MSLGSSERRVRRVFEKDNMPLPSPLATPAFCPRDTGSLYHSVGLLLVYRDISASFMIAVFIFSGVPALVSTTTTRLLTTTTHSFTTPHPVLLEFLWWHA
jgi:hypothetical protein